MKKILFVTGNARKAWQAEDILKPLGIAVEVKDLDITEIQADDPLAITQAKAQAAYEQLKQPLFVCDHSWSVPALNGFPGGYMKNAHHWFSAEDWLTLMATKQDRSIILTESIVYIDGEQIKTFSATFPAHIIDEPRGEGEVPMEKITVFDGETETIAERVDKREHSRKTEDSAYRKFGEWYANQTD